MSYSIRTPIFNGQSVNGGLALGGGAFAATRFCPEIDMPDAIDHMYLLFIEGITGAPTSGDIRARFMTGIKTTGAQNEYASPVYQNLNKDLVPSLLPDSDWPIVLADFSLAAALLIQRRIIGGFAHRLALDFTLAGGVSPAATLSLSVVSRFA